MSNWLNSLTLFEGRVLTFMKKELIKKTVLAILAIVFVVISIMTLVHLSLVYESCIDLFCIGNDRIFLFDSLMISKVWIYSILVYFIDIFILFFVIRKISNQTKNLVIKFAIVSFILFILMFNAIGFSVENYKYLATFKVALETPQGMIDLERLDRPESYSNELSDINNNYNYYQLRSEIAKVKYDNTIKVIWTYDLLALIITLLAIKYLDKN